MNVDDKIYLAGHNGMVGSAIMRKLGSLGYNNVVTCDFKALDLINQRDTEAFFESQRPDYVFLAAARVGGIMANNVYRGQFIYENLMIQSNVTHAAWKYGVKKLLFLGSSCIYPKMAPQPLMEDYLLTGPLEPTNEPYAIAKIAGVKMCESYNRQYGCNFISVMPSNLYGLNDNFDLETSHVLPAMIRKFHLAKCLENNDWDSIRNDLTRRPIGQVNGGSSDADIVATLANQGISTRTPQHYPSQRSALSAQRAENFHSSSLPATLKLWGTGTPLREFLYVDDLADAVVFVMQHDLKHDLYNIGSGKDLTIKELAAMIQRVTGYKGNVEWDSSKPDGTPRKLLDVSRLGSEGWTGRISLEKGIEETYLWYLQSQ